MFQTYNTVPWDKDGTGIYHHNMQARHYNDIWSYAFIKNQLYDSTIAQLLIVIDESSLECLVMDASQHLNSHHLIESFQHLFLLKSCPKYISSNREYGMSSLAMKKWLEKSTFKTQHLRPDIWKESSYLDSFISVLRDELLTQELFSSIDELRYILDRWRLDYNHYRPHSSLDYMTPSTYSSMQLKRASINKLSPKQN